MQILVTGASGFVASHLLPLLLAKGWRVRGAVRYGHRLRVLPPGVEGVVVGELGPETSWSLATEGIDVVVHLAARVHVMHDRGLDEYESANVIGTRKLAETAAAIGVKRFLFVSSVKAMGEVSPGNAPWSEKDECHPEDSYGKSKLAAELALYEITARTNMAPVILRPPVVYGPGVAANIYSLLRLIDHGWPLPLGSVKNRRSFVYVENFADAIVRAIEHPNAAGQTFLVSDGQDLSTPELVRAIARAFGKGGHLLPVPPLLLRIAGWVLGRSDEVNRAVGSLVVDSSKIRRFLDWRPPFTMDDGLAKTARWYIAMKSRTQTSPLLISKKEYPH